MASGKSTISATLLPCLKSFNDLLVLVQISPFATTEVPFTLWQDELGRFRVWAANIGAHQTGQASLDFRLRDASHIKNQIIRLLEDLDRTVEEVKIVLDERYAAGDTIALDSFAGDDLTTELQELHEQLLTIIDGLFQMSILTREPAQHDILIKSRLEDVKGFEPFDREHTSKKLPYADRDIIQRLGNAITRRRGYLKYRERHHAKLGKGLGDIQDQSEMSETTATDFQSRNIDFEETYFNSGVSDTSYASSLADGGTITIPVPAKESADGKPFECPYCFFMVTIKGTRSWIKHIFKDLQPYICTFQGCSRPDKLYDSRREWFDHISTAHL